MIYIFLTNSIGGYSGGPCYVRNKASWLKKQGWEVYVFDSTSQIFEPIVFDELKEYSGNRIPELYYHPSWFSRTTRNKIIAKIINKIGSSDNCVIESNLEILSEWGELIASKLSAVHIIYLISENGSVTDKDEFKYYHFKSNRGEFFTINEKRFQTFFSKFINISCEEAQKHVLQAMNASSIECCSWNGVNQIPIADYYIGHFGRVKNYLPYVLQEINEFAKKHGTKKICFACLGISEIPSEYKKYLSSDNIYVNTFPSQSPIPQKFFEKFKVIIATAGCASMAYRNENIVISMDVENCEPIGIMGLTTQSSSYRTVNEDDHRSLEALLTYIFEDKEFCLQKITKAGKYVIDYQSHLLAIPNGKKEYFYFSGRLKIKSFGDIITVILLKLGFVRLRTLIRNYAFTKQIVKSYKFIFR